MERDTGHPPVQLAETYYTYGKLSILKGRQLGVDGTEHNFTIYFLGPSADNQGYETVAVDSSPSLHQNSTQEQPSNSNKLPCFQIPTKIAQGAITDPTSLLEGIRDHSSPCTGYHPPSRRLSTSP